MDILHFPRYVSVYIHLSRWTDFVAMLIGKHHGVPFDILMSFPLSHLENHVATAILKIT